MQKNSIKIISISGLDGSGKTTQVQLLKNYLEKQGKKVFYFHAIQFSIATKINKFLKKIKSILSLSKKERKKINQDLETIKKQDSGNSVVRANWFLIQFRKIFLIIDIFRFKKLVKKIKKQGFVYLVTDRYFYDSVVNIEFLTQKLFLLKIGKKDNKKNSNFFANTQTCLVIHIIEKIIPRPDEAFYLFVSPTEIMNRDRLPEQGLNYLNIKNTILNQNFEKWNLKKILGEKSKEEVFKKLISHLSLS